MNSNLLKGVIVRNGDTQENLAEVLNLQTSGVNARINGKIDFRASEIVKIMKRYHLTNDEAAEIFFDAVAS